MLGIAGSFFEWFWTWGRKMISEMFEKIEHFGKCEAFLKNNMNLMLAWGFSDRANWVIYGHFTEKTNRCNFCGWNWQNTFFEGILMVFSKQTSPHFLHIFLHPYSASGGNKSCFFMFFMLQNAKSNFFEVVATALRPIPSWGLDFRILVRKRRALWVLPASSYGGYTGALEFRPQCCILLFDNTNIAFFFLRAGYFQIIIIILAAGAHHKL